jgi:hypothetical protein
MLGLRLTGRRTGVKKIIFDLEHSQLSQKSSDLDIYLGRCGLGYHCTVVGFVTYR